MPLMTSGAATATALALEPIPSGLQIVPGSPAAKPATEGEADPDPKPSYQPSLFRDVLTGAKVIPIPTLTPLRMPSEARKPRNPPARNIPSQSPAGPRPPRRGSLYSLQTELFEPGQAYDSATDSSAAYAPPGEVIYGDAQVASPQHRMLAAAVDAAVVLIAVGVFLGMFLVCGGELDLNRQLLMLLAGVGVVIGLFYHFLYCLADGDTPGMLFTGLRLVDFDGRTPDREKRNVRLAAALLSLLSAGLGLVWALVDEENLTWHDHISKTFPTAG
jgi:uncharacterized RDD family membrane protein YckC